MDNKKINLIYNNEKNVKCATLLDIQFIQYIHLIENMYCDLNLSNLNNNVDSNNLDSNNLNIEYPGKISNNNITIIIDLLDCILNLDKDNSDNSDLINKLNKGDNINKKVYKHLYTNFDLIIQKYFKNIEEIEIIKNCIKIANFCDYFDIPIILEFIIHFKSLLIINNYK